LKGHENQSQSRMTRTAFAIIVLPHAYSFARCNGSIAVKAEFRRLKIVIASPEDLTGCRFSTLELHCADEISIRRFRLPIVLTAFLP
jgi:hypothetical protein